MEDNGKLAFLDVALEARPDGTFSHAVYRKPTHTDRYLHGTSHHHPRHLASVAKSLTNRAYELCDNDHLAQELEHLEKVLRLNGHATIAKRTERNHNTTSVVERHSAYFPQASWFMDLYMVTRTEPMEPWK
ncbi:uncharacterized protein [Epargyreus clarus]|uniref:uncharacterized protein n=1 Tax=Epargyreus clarus TaxID=520877 RepID=UPI003C2FD538